MAHSPVMSALTGRCPMCDEGRAFSGPLSMHSRCDVCGVVFDRDEGFWTGAVTLPYIIACFWVVSVLAIAFATGRIMDPALGWFVPVSTVAITGAMYPLSKRFWLGLYGEWGYLYPDPEPAPEPAASSGS